MEFGSCGGCKPAHIVKFGIHGGLEGGACQILNSTDIVKIGHACASQGKGTKWIKLDGPWVHADGSGAFHLC